MSQLVDQCKSTEQQSALLRILQTTDLYAHALAFDYNNNNLFARRGLSRCALQIENAKATDKPCLLFDTGDFLQGSPIADRLAQEPETNHDTHPMITAMNLLGYDAATIGNHDLDFGIDHLAASLAQANFPFVSANLLLPPHVASQLKRYVILERALVGYDTP
ncbi:MAG: 2',3'-cyclic-nucleotide 2'-phosphodiesterase, partial [Lentibacter algarum]